MVERLQRLAARDRDGESRALCRNLRPLLGDKPDTVAAYLPYTDEPDIKPLLQQLLDGGWTVVMPALAHNKLVFRRITELGQVTRNPLTRIYEPGTDCPNIDDAAIVTAIVPGRAFTQSCDRMGRGNGGYDHWISAQRKRNPATRYVGACFECQIMPELPMEPHDQRVNAVVTCRNVFGSAIGS